MVWNDYGRTTYVLLIPLNLWSITDHDTANYIGKDVSIQRQSNRQGLLLTNKNQQNLNLS